MRRDGGTLCLHEGMVQLGADRAPSVRECLAGGPEGGMAGGSGAEAAGLGGDVAVEFIEADDHGAAADFAIVVPFCGEFCDGGRVDAEFLEAEWADDGDHGVCGRWAAGEWGDYWRSETMTERRSRRPRTRACWMTAAVDSSKR